MALALSYKGSWLGAWWTLDGIKHYVQNAHELRLSEYSALRWLHVPILAPELEPALRGAIQRTPLHFVNAWVNHSELPQGIHHSEDGFDTFSILRHFLWNEFPAHCRREAIKTIGRCNPPFEEVRCRKHLGDIADISPVLLWDGIEQCGRKCENRFHFLLQIFQNSQIDLPKDAGETTVFRRLSTLQDRASDVTRLGKERLQEVCKHRIRSLEASEKLEKPLTDLDRHDLLRLGATLNGRRYIAAHVAQHFLSQPTK
jgi:hypothetical protein